MHPLKVSERPPLPYDLERDTDLAKRIGAATAHEARTCRIQFAFAPCVAHRELAREAVRKSLVLLKKGRNPNKPFLPLDRNAKRILVAGTNDDGLGYQRGGWTIFWHVMAWHDTWATIFSFNVM